MAESYFDIIIVGGGLVGLNLIHALRKTNLKIALIDAKSANPMTSPPAKDRRSLALGLASCHTLENFGLWDDLINQVTPIQSVHVSDKGHFGFTRLRAQDYGVDTLGYIVPYQPFSDSLWQKAQHLTNVTFFVPATVQAVTYDDQKASCTIITEAKTMQLTTELLIIADGTHSRLRDQLTFTTEMRELNQSAIVTNLEVTSTAYHVAYERFCGNTTLALLPQHLKHYGLAWTGPTETMQNLHQLPEKQFLAAAQTAFGHRLGRFTALGERTLYPLVSLLTKEQAKPHCLLLGNTAHTLPPVAAQGFNLSLRDIDATAKFITQHASTKTYGALSQLIALTHTRYKDQKNAQRLSMGLIQLFSNPLSTVQLGRNLALICIDALPPLKRLLAERGMGFVH